MKKFDLFDKVQETQQREVLPVGGYKCKIMKAEEIEYSWGSVVVVSFDIADGEYKDFFARDYKNNTSDNKKWRGTIRFNQPNGKSEKADEFNARRFKTFIKAVEKSNNGYSWSWDEKTLKDKLVGFVFGEEEWEYDGRSGMAVKAQFATEYDKATGATIPAPKMLTKGNQPAQTIAQDDDDLPF